MSTFQSGNISRLKPIWLWNPVYTSYQVIAFEDGIIFNGLDVSIIRLKIQMNNYTSRMNEISVQNLFIAICRNRS